jgi:hypothetical protein
MSKYLFVGKQGRKSRFMVPFHPGWAQPGN